ncbi:hypothetical protein DFQ27_009940, partial [Actinomortierella ambigua]
IFSIIRGRRQPAWARRAMTECQCPPLTSWQPIVHPAPVYPFHLESGLEQFGPILQALTIHPQKNTPLHTSTTRELRSFYDRARWTPPVFTTTRPESGSRSAWSKFWSDDIPHQARTFCCSTMTLNVLFVGNPGVGKSYFLNLLGGAFASGFSIVHGLTEKHSYCESYIGGSKVRLIDAPGMLESSGKLTLRSAQEITAALSMDGGYKLIFVVGECSGRVSPSILYMINKVMTAIDFSIDVGAIINKVSENQLQFYDDASTRTEIIQQLNSVANNRIKREWMRATPYSNNDNRKGASSRVTELLQGMTFQYIPCVKNILATIPEHDQFTKRVKKDYKQGVKWLTGHSQAEEDEVREIQEKPIQEGAAENAEVAENYEQPSKCKPSAPLTGTTTAITSTVATNGFAGVNDSRRSDERDNAVLTQRESTFSSEQQHNCTPAPLSETYHHTLIFIEELDVHQVEESK